MKYKLKKDLPFAKAGVKVWLESTGFVYCETSMGNRKIDTNCGGMREIEKLLSEGWIEEVKPREWWVVIDCQGGLSGDGTRWSQQMAELIAFDNNQSSFRVMDLTPYKAIKVVEVINENN